MFPYYYQTRERPSCYIIQARETACAAPHEYQYLIASKLEAKTNTLTQIKCWFVRSEKQSIPWLDRDEVTAVGLRSLRSLKLPIDFEKSGAVLNSFICIKKRNKKKNRQNDETYDPR